MLEFSFTFLELVRRLRPARRYDDPFLSVVPVILGPLVSSVDSLLSKAPVSLAVEFMLCLLASTSLERSCSRRPNTFFVRFCCCYGLSPPVCAALLVRRLNRPSPSGLKFYPEFLMRLGRTEARLGDSRGAGDTFLYLLCIDSC